MASTNGSSLIRLMISAASAIRRAGLEAIVKSAPSLKLVGSAYGDPALAHLIEEAEPDILLADIAEASTATVIFERAAAVHTVLLVDGPEFAWTAAALRAGVRGILPRDSSADEIISAVHLVHRGLIGLDPEIVTLFVERIPALDQRDGDPSLEELTPRENDILRMLAEGVGNKEIASALEISEHTVKFHVSSILNKLGAGSRTEAVTMGLRRGMIVL